MPLNTVDHQINLIKKNALVWGVVLIWLSINIGLLFKFKAPDWDVSYCRQQVNLRN